MTTTTDPRYTDEKLASYTPEQIREHLEARQSQHANARMQLESVEAEIAGMTDYQLENTTAGDDAFARARSLAAEIAEQRRNIAKLAKAGTRVAEADYNTPMVEMVDDAIALHGMPCGIEEAGDLAMAAGLWRNATIALENEADEMPTNVAVAQRVADAYALVYGYDALAKHPTRDDVNAAKADAAKLAENSGTPIGAEITRALLVCLLDPKIRIHLDPNALEQARRALGLDD